MSYLEPTAQLIIRTGAFSLRDPGRAQELCESPGGRPGLPVPTGPYGLCGRKATLNDEVRDHADRFLDQLRQGWVGFL